MVNLYIYDQMIIIDLIVILLLRISASLFKYLTVFRYILLRIVVGKVLGKLRMGRNLNGSHAQRNSGYLLNLCKIVKFIEHIQQMSLLSSHDRYIPITPLLIPIRTKPCYDQPDKARSRRKHS